MLKVRVCLVPSRRCCGAWYDARSALALLYMSCGCPLGSTPRTPLSRLQGEYRGDKLKAECMAWLIYKQLLRDPSVVQFGGVLCLSTGTES